MSGYLEIRALTRSYGKQRALAGLDLTIPKHSVTAFIGANGAGKTTTFSIIGGFISPASGEVRIDGELLNKYRAKGGVIGLLPQDVQFYENRTVERQLYMFARLAGFSSEAASAEVLRVLELVSLEDRLKDMPSGLSRGMKVRLGIAQALVGNPPLVLLDEPTAGLDPQMLLVFRKCIESIRGTTTILISSHDLRELQDLCDYVTIIDKGRLIKQGPMQELLSGSSQIVYKLSDFSAKFKDFYIAFSSLSPKLNDDDILVVNYQKDICSIVDVNKQILRWLIDHGVGIISVDAQQSLEKAYFEAL